MLNALLIRKIADVRPRKRCGKTRRAAMLWLATGTALVPALDAADATVMHLYGNNNSYLWDLGSFTSGIAQVYVNGSASAIESAYSFSAEGDGGALVTELLGTVLYGSRLHTGSSGSASFVRGRHSLSTYGQGAQLVYTADIYDQLDVVVTSNGSTRSFSVDAQPTLSGHGPAGFRTDGYTYYTQAFGGGLTGSGLYVKTEQLFAGPTSAPIMRSGLYGSTAGSPATIQMTPVTSPPPPPPSPETPPVIIGPDGSFLSPSGGIIPERGNMSPFPLLISVDGTKGVLTDLNVTLSGLTHSYSSDLHFLLEAPNGQAAYLMGSVGAGGDWTSANITFDQQASSMIANGNLASGTYLPSVRSSATVAPFASNATQTSLDIFNGLSGSAVNGVWKLYGYDAVAGDLGSLAGAGLKMSFAPTVPEPATWAMMIAGFGLAGAASRRRIRATVVRI